MMTRNFSTLVLIDSTVESVATLLEGITPEAEVVVLDAQRDRLEQTTQILSQRQGITSLHLVTHGQPGSLQMGSQSIGLAALAQNRSRFQRWTAALHQQAAVFLYGCEVAQGAVGQAFVRRLSELLQRPIAASTTRVGNAALGGNWNLDFTTAKLRPVPVFATAAQQAYPAVLATLLSESFTGADVTNPNWRFGIGTPGSANPFLTARATTAPSTGGLPGTPTGTAADTPGQGALRLTQFTGDQATFVLYNQAITASAGLNITFKFYAYGNNELARAGADGISFFLIDGSANPTQAGAFGGSLGYAQKSEAATGVTGGVPGIVGGYLGIGLDEFGNFSAQSEGRVGGRSVAPGGPPTTDRVPQSVAVRGSQATQYQYLTGTDTLSPTLDDTNTNDRSEAERGAQILISPRGLLTVRIDLNNNDLFTDAGETVISNFDVTAPTANNAPLPAQFKFGFASSTGGSINIHEIRNLNIATFGAPPETANASQRVPATVNTNLTGLSGTDSDGPIAGFAITTLPAPAQGQLFLGNPASGGTPITAGQVLTSVQANNLFFDATPGFTGGSFTYATVDNDGARDLTPATFTLQLQTGTNQPPVTNPTRVSATPGNPVRVTGLEGNDPDGTIASFVISTLPPGGQGSLFLGNPNSGGSPVRAGQRLTPAQAASLFFQPGPNFNGTRFTYAAIDNDGAIDPTPAVVTVQRDANRPPVTDPTTVSTRPGNPVRVTGLEGSDPDGTIARFVISTLPPATQGALFLGNPANGGRPVRTGQRLTPAQAATLFFQPSPSFTGARFTYAAIDNDGAIDPTPAVVSLQRSATPTPPNLCLPGITRRGNNRDNTLIGTRNRDTLLGGNGNDLLRGLGCPDRLVGGRGNDRLFGNQGNDVAYGRQGNDRVFGGAGSDQIFGGAGRNLLRGQAGNDRIIGGPQRDREFGDAGNDRLVGRGGRDSLFGGAGNDRAFGGIRADRLAGAAGNDILNGDDGDDLITGGGGNDRVAGGRGNDTLGGGSGDDVVAGSVGRDILRGRGGNDRLFGNPGRDRLTAGEGNDVLVGGNEADVLIGGGGSDRFVYLLATQGVDQILDFARADRIDLRPFTQGPAFSAANPFAAYVRLSRQGSNTQVQIDANGNAPGGQTPLAVLVGVSPAAINRTNFIFG